MPDPNHWSHQLHPLPDGTYQLEAFDERGGSLPVARQITEGQARSLLKAIEQEANRRRFAIAEIIRDPEFMARTVMTVKRSTGR